jgi:copper transport protein
MRCEEAHEAISARLDGEPVDDVALDGHLDQCPRCPNWLSAAHSVTRRARLLPAPAVPDLTERIVAAVHADRQRPTRSSQALVQFGLVVVAAVQMGMALVMLLGGHDHEAPLHVAHEMGSFNLALALAYLVTGLQPFRAGGLLPFAGIAATLLAGTAGIDLAARRTSPTEEVPHLLAVVGFFLLWKLLDKSHPNSATGLRQQVAPTLNRMVRRSRPSSPRARRVFAVLLGVAVAVPVLAGPADAHAVLESTTPNSSAVLPAQANVVTLHFDEPVTLLPNGIRVLDPSGKRVDRGDAGHPGNSADAQVSLRAGLPNGTYLVDWRVVSADSHPIGGAYTFSIGAAGGKVANAGSGAGGDHSVGLLLGLSRLITFIALALLVGAAAFVLTCWQAGRNRRSIRRLLIGSCAGVAATAVSGLLLQGPYAAGLSLTSVADPQLIRTVLGSPYGHAVAARLVLSGVAAIWLAWFLRAGAAQLQRVVSVGAALGVALLATLPLGGHANSGSHRTLALLADTAHLAAVAVWLGGLAVLTGLLLRRRQRRELPAVVARFSPIAFGSVVVLVATGIYAGIRQVGSFPALVGTTYGRLLLLKVGLVLLVLAVAAVSRKWARRHRVTALASNPETVDVTALAVDEPELVLAGVGSGYGDGSDAVEHGHGPGGSDVAGLPPAGTDLGDGAADEDPGPAEVRRLRRSVLAEVIVAIGILVVTSVLVVSQPAKTAYGPVQVVNDTSAVITSRLTAGPVIVRATPLTVAPRRLDFRISTFTTTGDPRNVPELTGELRLPSQGLGPLPVTFRSAGLGRYVASNVSVPLAGKWQLQLNVRVDDFNAYPAQMIVTVD